MSHLNGLYFNLFPEWQFFEKIIERFLDSVSSEYLIGYDIPTTEYTYRKKNYLAGLVCINGYLNSKTEQDKRYFMNKISKSINPKVLF